MTFGRRHSEHERCICDSVVAQRQGGHVPIYAVSAPVSFNVNDQVLSLRRALLPVNPRGVDAVTACADIVCIRVTPKE